MRSRACGLSCHVWTGPKHGSFFSINDEFCVSTPEACFIQMAGSLPLIHLIELGFLLCGTYAPSAVDLPMTCGLQPLTNLSRLNNYIDRCSGESGVVNARRALKYVRDGSASVMETKLTMLLCLPRMLGGIGLPLPELNAEILIPSNLTGRTLTNVRRPDLFWPDRNVAVEYDSNEYHSVAERVVEDSRRKNELTSCGIQCLVARWDDVVSEASFNRLAEELRVLLEIRKRPFPKGYFLKVHELRRALIGSGRWAYMS